MPNIERETRDWFLGVDLALSYHTSSGKTILSSCAVNSRGRGAPRVLQNRERCRARPGGQDIEAGSSRI